MTWTITIRCEQCSETYTIPFECFQSVYYVHKKKWWKKNSKWVITKTRIVSAWATNTYGVTLNDNTHICENEFKYLFINRDDAIEFCLKKNTHTKVKIYGE